MTDVDQDSIEPQNLNRSLSFTRPLETSTVQDGRSRGDSYTPSDRTRSTYSYISPNSLSTSPPVPPGPPPETIPSPATARPRLRTTNPDPSDEPEYMNVPRQVSGVASGFRNDKIVPKRDLQSQKRNGLIGGFVKGLRRIPRAVMRGTIGGPRPIPQDGSHFDGTETFPTLPRYRSTPPTPTLTSAPAARRVANNQALHDATNPHNVDSTLPPSLIPGRVQRRRSRHNANPSFHLTSPREQPSAISTPLFPQPELSGSVSQDQVPVGDNALPTISPHPTRIEVDDSQPHIDTSSRSRPGTSVLVPEESHIPAGDPLPVHPQPTTDYRRMSNYQTNPSSAASYEPSFSTELNGPSRFLSVLFSLPWIASDRITVDYQPGLSRGGWGWKRMAVSIDKNGAALVDSPRHRERQREKVMDGNHGIVYKPVSKPLMSWYTGLPSNPTGKNISRWINSVHRDTVDLLSSGSPSGGRSSLATETRLSSAAGPPTRERKRRSFGSGQKLYFAPNQFSFLDTSPRAAAKAMRKMQRTNSTAKRPRKPTSPQRPHYRHRDGVSPSRQGTMPTYPHGYVPAASYQPNVPPLASPAIQPSAPVYVFQTQSTPPLPPVANMSEQHANNSPSSVGAVPLLSPVYMQVLPGPPPLPGDASPAGFAGRGAGGGYGPAYGYIRYGAPGQVYESHVYHGDGANVVHSREQER